MVVWSVTCAKLLLLLLLFCIYCAGCQVIITFRVVPVFDDVFAAFTIRDRSIPVSDESAACWDARITTWVLHNHLICIVSWMLVSLRLIVFMAKLVWTSTELHVHAASNASENAEKCWPNAPTMLQQCLNANLCTPMLQMVEKKTKCFASTLKSRFSSIIPAYKSFWMKHFGKFKMYTKVKWHFW